MKRFLMSIALCLSIMMGWAQVEARYDKGNVPVVNGRVMFQETVATSLSEGEAYERIGEWAKQRFNKPNVIVSKFTAEDETNHTLNLTAETVGEYRLSRDGNTLTANISADQVQAIFGTEISTTAATLTLKIAGNRLSRVILEYTTADDPAVYIETSYT